jgi:outer membrane protein OmpA-like peptidoglycan-associated protein/opacity protein-like surface antigen
MASKKYILIAGLLGLLQTATFAQKNDASDSWALDSSKVSTKNMPQHNEFMNNSYPYPAKPRTMGELGFGGGLAQIYGDVAQRFGYGGSVSYRKALSHVISLRISYFGSINYGIDGERRYLGGVNGSTEIYGTPNPWAVYGRNPFSTSYRTKIHQLALDAIISLNALSKYRGNPKTDWYALIGYGFQGADVDVNALNAQNQPYNFKDVSFGGTLDYSQTTAQIQKQIASYEDNTYESNAPVQRGNRYFVGRAFKDNWLLNHGFNFGGGFAFRLSDRVNIAIEQRFTITGDDNLDGIYSGQSADIQSNTQARINLNIGNSAKRILPLWWINGNNYIYDEVNAPKHMKMPPVVLPDADGDGVTDQFDMEPNTPKGCAVDSHGVSLDTDGDGVPDCKDKEKLTLASCFPVDADGVGKCPEPPCCDSIAKMAATMKAAATCNLGTLPSITFKGSSVTIGKDAQALLASAAAQINANPDCKVKVVGYGASSKSAQQLSWDRVHAVINYLVSKQGISENRLEFYYGQNGDSNTVDLQGTMEEGPNTVPAPHPNLQKSK